MSEFLFKAIVIGVGGTAAMDVWAILLNRVLGIPKPNWALAGRWFCNVAQGRVFHDDIGAAAPWRNELAIGWAGHYAVGIAYGGILLLVAGPGSLLSGARQPDSEPAGCGRRPPGRPGPVLT